MKRRKRLVFCEILLTIISLISLFAVVLYIPIIMFHALCEEKILYINKTNINIIESHIDFNNKVPKKIIYFSGFDDDVDKYTIYYMDNSKEDYLEKDIGSDLGKYIGNKGHKRYYYDGMIAIIFGIISITSYCISKHIGNKIELQDKLEMEERL